MAPTTRSSSRASEGGVVIQPNCVAVFRELYHLAVGSQQGLDRDVVALLAMTPEGYFEIHFQQLIP